MPGTAAVTQALSTLTVFSATSSTSARSSPSCRDHDVGLEHDAAGKGLPSRAFGPFQRVVRATSTHGTYIKSVAGGAALFQNRTAR
jgi:hypothetical protein